MVGRVTLVALAAVFAVALLALIRRPAGTQRIARLSGLAIIVLTAAALTPLTVRDSGSAAIYLVEVPVRCSGVDSF